MSQQQVRDRTAKLWRAGASCFGGNLQHWAACLLTLILRSYVRLAGALQQMLAFLPTPCRPVATSMTREAALLCLPLAPDLCST
eukprot:6460613-Amphidinium_carterae.1